MKTTRRFLIVSISIFITALSFGQANFTGSWALNESKSNIGEGFRMFAPAIAITQDANTFTIERTYKGQDGQERKSTEKYTLDGKESVNTVFNNTQKKSTASWSDDKQSLKVSSAMTFEFNGESNEIKTVETYKLADGGAGLTIDSQSTSSRGERKMLLAYDKK
jgi:cytochrome oxidase assembly protein ShyY1